MVASQSRLDGRAAPAWRRLPGRLLDLLLSKADGCRHSAALAAHSRAIRVTGERQRRIRAMLAEQLAADTQEQQPEPNDAADRELIAAIRQRTAEANRNNVTRTDAYWRLYRSHPELHWSFLAHMVSRNAGWNMTDLRGELLPQLLGERPAGDMFRMLERANALIFHDAYPQLLLYQESVLRGENMFRLLPQLGVSRFMQPLWHDFWASREPAPLTIGLIVNEQHYIEGRVVRNPAFRRSVLDTLPVKLQRLLQLNQVVLPYGVYEHGTGRNRRLAGLVLERFADVQERIAFGMSLYAILFGNAKVAAGADGFAAATAHSGSRADYWPGLFTPERRGDEGRRGAARMRHGALTQGAVRFYSPALEDVWPDKPMAAPERGDWFRDLSAADSFAGKLKAPLMIDITGEHAFGVGKLELAAAASRLLGG